MSHIVDVVVNSMISLSIFLYHIFIFNANRTYGVFFTEKIIFKSQFFIDHSAQYYFYSLGIDFELQFATYYHYFKGIYCLGVYLLPSRTSCLFVIFHKCTLKFMKNGIFSYIGRTCPPGAVFICYVLKRYKKEGFKMISKHELFVLQYVLRITQYQKIMKIT